MKSCAGLVGSDEPVPLHLQKLAVREMQTGSPWCPATLQRKTEMQPKAWAVGITTAADNHISRLI